MAPACEQSASHASERITLEAFIEEQQISELKLMIPLGVMTTLGTSSLLVASLYNQVPRANLMVWIGCVYLVSLFRWLDMASFMKSTFPQFNFSEKQHICWGHFLAGVVWGVSAVLIFPEGSLMHQAVFTLLLGGMVAGSLGIYAQRMSIFFAFALPLILPLTVRFFIMGGLHQLLGLFMLAFLIFVVSGGKKINKNAMTKWTFEYENNQLIHTLEEEKVKLQQSYEMMAREVKERKIVSDELLKYKQELEQRVIDRTRALEKKIYEHEQLEQRLLENEEKLAHQAFHDALTDLPNRLLLKERLEQAILRSKRSGKMGALLFVDLDGFKEINDTLGHDAGDQLLIDLSQRFREYCRLEDTVARLGGDEFMFILEKIHDVIEVRDVCDRLQKGLQVPFHIAGQEILANISIGITIFPDDGDDALQLMKNCDLAMYQGKGNGKNGYCFFTQTMNEALQGRMTMAHDLRKAIRREEFVLCFQPKVDIVRGIITGSEALLRWVQPDGTLVLPEQFITVAESTGLIQEIGDWVLNAAIRQNQEWNSQGFADLEIAINISISEFQHENLLAKLGAVVAETGILPENITLEITENIIIADVDKAISIMSALAELGVGIALDDFGTGYSSLHYLRGFPLKLLKIDKSFVEPLPENHGYATIAAAIIGLAHNLNLSVVAEGVENMAQLQFLQAAQCEEVQGYLFSEPLPAQEFTRVLHDPSLILSNIVLSS